jgi:peptide/nickel transport system substrate-binding protein
VTLLRRVHARRLPRFIQWKYIQKVLSPFEWRMLKFSSIVLIVSICWAGWNVLAKYRLVVPDVGGRYVEAVIGSPERVNPLFASVNEVDQDISRLVYSGLMRYDEQQRLVPDLAATYQVSDDKKIYTFSLRTDVVWHDGEPFSAKDIVFTFEKIQDPDVNSSLHITFEGVEVKALDDHTVQFILNEPFNPFLSTLTVGIIPEHIWFDIEPKRMMLAKQNLQPIGTGPFFFKKLAKDETGFIYSYELNRFDRYYKQPPYLEEFVFRFFSEYDGATGAIIALREQKVDGLSFVPYALRDKVMRKHITLHTLRLPQYTALFFNQDQEPALKSLEVRTALAFALDKSRLVQQALKGEAEVIESPILNGFPGFQAGTKPSVYSMDEANTLLDKIWPRISADEYRKTRHDELLKERGIMPATTTIPAYTSSTAALPITDHLSTSSTLEQVERDIERQLQEEFSDVQTFYRKNKTGEILAITITTADTQEYHQVAQTIVGLWQEIGVKTDVVYVSPRDITRDVLKNRQYDLLLYGLIIGNNPDQYPFWHSSQIAYPGLNIARYQNRDVDDLLKKTREVSDEQKLGELYQKFQEAILKDKPAIFLYTPTYTYATTNRVSGIDTERIFSPSDRFAGVIKWYTDTKIEWKI